MSFPIKWETQGERVSLLQEWIYEGARARLESQPVRPFVHNKRREYYGGFLSESGQNQTCI